jgi:hypothetical protein
MVSRDQADREEQLADVQEGTEQRMHSAADVLPTANRYMSVPSSSAHAPRSIEIEPSSFESMLPLMTTRWSGRNGPRWSSTRCAGFVGHHGEIRLIIGDDVVGPILGGFGGGPDHSGANASGSSASAF